MTYLFSKWVCLLYIYVVLTKNLNDMKKKMQGNVENNSHSFANGSSNPYRQFFDPSYKDNSVEYITENGKVGMRNSQGIVIIPPINDEIIARHMTGYIVRQGKQMGIMLQDGQGTLLAPCIYDNIRFDISTLGFRAVKDGKAGILNMLGEVVIPCEYDDVGKICVGSGPVSVLRGDEWGYVEHETLRFVTQEEYENGEVNVICSWDF